jgi:hypothetical protein
MPARPAGVIRWAFGCWRPRAAPDTAYLRIAAHTFEYEDAKAH